MTGGPDHTGSGVANNLTDGTGVSKLTGSKVLKDFVADFLLTAAAAAATVPIANAFGVPTTGAEVLVFGTAILGAFVRAGYRATLRWATT